MLVEKTKNLFGQPVFVKTSPDGNSVYDLKIDASTLALYKTCSLLYLERVRRCIVPKVQPVGLCFGKVLHKGREVYKKGLMANHTVPEALGLALCEIEKRWEQWIPPSTYGLITKENKAKREKYSLNNAIRLFTGYVDKVCTDKYKPLLVESCIEMDFGVYRFPDFKTVVNCTYVMKLDELSLFDDRLYVVDLKTSSIRPGPHAIEGYVMSAALQGYVYSIRINSEVQAKLKREYLPRDVACNSAQAMVHEIWVNAEPEKQTTRTVKLDDYFKVFPIFYSDEQLSEWSGFTYWTIHKLLRDYFNLSTYHYNVFAPNDKFCTMYGGCSYLELHSSPKELRERIIEGSYSYDEKGWSPYDQD